jgi:hypothetical protein
MESDALLLHLVHKIFIGSEDGKKLLQLFKEKDAQEIVFPVDVEKQNQHGGALGWATFKAGERNWLKNIELMAMQYAQLIDASNKPKRG